MEGLINTDELYTIELSGNPSAILYQVVKSDEDQTNDIEKLKRLIDFEKMKFLSSGLQNPNAFTLEDIKSYYLNTLQNSLLTATRVLEKVDKELKSFEKRLPALEEKINGFEGKLKSLESELRDVDEKDKKSKENQLKQDKSNLEDTKNKLSETKSEKSNLEKERQKIVGQIDKLKLKIEEIQGRKTLEEFEQDEKLAFAEIRQKMLDYIGGESFIRYFEKEGDVLDVIKENLDNSSIHFYIIARNDHWYFIIQERDNLFIFDPSLRDVSERMIDTIKKDIKKDNKSINIFRNKEKIQYNSGCCEMYAIMLPFMLYKLQYENNLPSIMNIINIEQKRFTLPVVLFSGLCEQAFGDSVSGKEQDQSAVMEDRINMLKKQIEELKQEKIKLLLNGRELSNIFISQLSREVEFLTANRETLKKLKMIKGGFMFRYAVKTISEISNSKGSEKSDSGEKHTKHSSFISMLKTECKSHGGQVGLL